MYETAPLSVRARLAIWHAGVLTLIICAFAAGILLLRQELGFTPAWTHNSPGRSNYQQDLS